MTARHRHIVAAGAAGGLISASLFLGQAAMTSPEKPVAVATRTIPAPHSDMLSGRSVAPTVFRTDEPAPVRIITDTIPATPATTAIPQPPHKPRALCRKHKKREA